MSRRVAFRVRREDAKKAQCSGGATSQTGTCPAGQTVTGPVLLYLQQAGVGGRTVEEAGTQSIVQREPAAFIQNLGDQAIQILQNKQLGQKDREAQFSKLFTQGFDVPEIGKFVMYPFVGAHTAFPMLQMPIAEFAKDGVSTRDFVMITNEATLRPVSTSRTK